MNKMSLFCVACLVFLQAMGIRAYGADAKSEIKNLEQEWEKALKAKDAAGIMKFYEPGMKLFVFDVVPPRQYVGNNAYKKDWEDTFNMFDGAITFEINDLH
jgi:ketosteroid isomerase-like protein